MTGHRINYTMFRLKQPKYESCFNFFVLILFLNTKTMSCDICFWYKSYGLIFGADKNSVEKTLITSIFFCL